MPHDVITFGEAMVRLAPPHFQRLEQARSLDIEIGGAELNTAVGVARLGRSSAWVSRLANNALGKLIANRVREAGVSDEHVIFAEDGSRCGLYFLEFGASPRASGLVYDRKDSAFAKASPGMFNWQAVFTGAKWFHVSGITPALGPGMADATLRALRAAKNAGLSTSIDLNYRSTLWSAEDAGLTMRKLLKSCDLLIASQGDAETLFGIKSSTFGEAAAKLVDTFGVKMVVGVQRETPLVWRNKFGVVGFASGKVFESPWYEVEIVDRLGAGDAMAAGLIDGLLDGDFERGILSGAAMGALKHSIPGDLPWITREEVNAVMSGHGLRIKR